MTIIPSLVKVLIECPGIYQHFMQVDVLPVRKEKNRDDGSCANEYSVHVFHFSIHTGNVDSGKKMLDPFFKFSLALLIQLTIKFYIVVQYFFVIIRQVDDLPCSSYPEYKKYNDDNQYKYKKYLENGDHIVMKVNNKVGSNVPVLKTGVQISQRIFLNKKNFPFLT